MRVTVRVAFGVGLGFSHPHKHSRTVRRTVRHPQRKRQAGGVPEVCQEREASAGALGLGLRRRYQRQIF